MKQVAVALAVAVLLFIITPNTSAQEQAPAPTYKNGDFWQFRVVERDWITRSSTALGGDYEVVWRNGKTSVLQIEAGQKVPVTHQGGNELRRMINIKSSLQILQFPLFLGKEWETEFQARFHGFTNVWWKSKSRVTGTEDIATAAGIFRAFKIERDYDTAGRACWVYTYFYSAETGSVVKYLYDGSCGGKYTGGKREIELIKFGAA